MLQVVDRTDTHTIQKVTGPKIAAYYQTIKTAMIGKGGQAEAHVSLRDAREAIGKVISHPVRDTAASKSYADQCSGYSRAN